ncbi:hypothetical protein LP7551_02135 [Roseibium album]|nr:hypothetical protein LP7551_02135 [Roseibium album]
MQRMEIVSFRYPIDGRSGQLGIFHAVPDLIRDLAPTNLKQSRSKAETEKCACDAHMHHTSGMMKFDAALCGQPTCRIVIAHDKRPGSG